MIDTNARGRILAIDPDPHSGAVLRRILENRVRADLEVVRTIDAALTSIAGQVPDVILTWAFVPPADLARLVEELQRRNDASHTQIISTPHALDAPEGPLYGDSERILRFPRQRTAGGTYHGDPVVLRRHVEHYLEQARALRVAARERQEQGLVPIGRGVLESRERGTGPATTPTALVLPTIKDVRALSAALRPTDRRAASRRRAADLAGQWGIRLDPAGDASIVDISRTGVRIETTADLNPGSLINLELIGMENTLSVAARLIRSEVVQPGAAEIRYRAAAMFVRELDLFPVQANPIMVAAAAASTYTPGILADLLGRVLANANWVSNGAALRSQFEAEVRALVRARDVRIRAVPVPTTPGCQSLYFSIPTVAARRHGLHIVFDRGYRPTAAEFRLLKAAASLAAVVMELTPAADAAPGSH